MKSRRAEKVRRRNQRIQEREQRIQSRLRDRMHNARYGGNLSSSNVEYEVSERDHAIAAGGIGAIDHK